MNSNSLSFSRNSIPLTVWISSNNVDSLGSPSTFWLTVDSLHIKKLKNKSPLFKAVTWRKCKSCQNKSSSFSQSFDTDFSHVNIKLGRLILSPARSLRDSTSTVKQSHRSFRMNCKSSMHDEYSLLRMSMMLSLHNIVWTKQTSAFVILIVVIGSMLKCWSCCKYTSRMQASKTFDIIIRHNLKNVVYFFCNWKEVCFFQFTLFAVKNVLENFARRFFCNRNCSF